jgi:hypothetical protein
MIKDCDYEKLSECIEISNGAVSVIAATGFGPRILSYSLAGGENVLGWHPQAEVKTPWGNWRPYGGHRLWLSPENMPNSYAPDNAPVEVSVVDDLSVHLKGGADAAGSQKEMLINLSETGTEVIIDHRLTVSFRCEAAVWALTIMRPGGVAVIPNEPFAGYSHENLLPVRSAALWSYTDLSDPRWEFTKDAIRLHVDEAHGYPQKIGVLNRRGWASYEWNDLVFTKRSEYVAGAVYPDMNSDFEIYTAGGFVEVETLSPLKMLAAGEAIEHREVWSLEQLDLP